MSTLLFLSGTNNKRFGQFIPTYTNHTVHSPPRVRKRKRQTSNGSPSQKRRPQLSPQTVTANDVHHVYAPLSPASSFSSFSSISLSTSPSLSPLSISSSSSSFGEYAGNSSCPRQQHQATVTDDIMDDKRKQLITLENEMDFTQDAWATLNVMFESVRLAYLNCAPQLSPHPTRLDAMEKELLSAYDDLELQVIHLDRHIQKLESSWYHYKATTNKQTNLLFDSSISSPLVY
ncbi:hypothetical protein BCR42DRAFT_422963 [Absidia repens]|uniref:Uncharacterized protein n=1 Tax=Absidia repens TaxID=90262 RepID=A0A1X2I6E1_9FUNG|nr:hypothetical protein BCR42DRAFT_422963 [Absidia repens]